VSTRCRLCNSPLRRDADAAFRGGATAVAVSRLTGVGEDTCKRHRRNGHVPGLAPSRSGARVLPPREAPTPAGAGGGAPEQAPAVSDERYRAIAAELAAMLADSPSPTNRLAILAEQRRLADSAARALGPPPSARPTWRELEGFAEYETAMFDALEPHPLARADLAAALKRLTEEAEQKETA